MNIIQIILLVYFSGWWVVAAFFAYMEGRKGDYTEGVVFGLAWPYILVIFIVRGALWLIAGLNKNNKEQT